MGIVLSALISPGKLLLVASRCRPNDTPCSGCALLLLLLLLPLSRLRPPWELRTALLLKQFGTSRSRVVVGSLHRLRLLCGGSADRLHPPAEVWRPWHPGTRGVGLTFFPLTPRLTNRQHHGFSFGPRCR